MNANNEININVGLIKKQLIENENIINNEIKNNEKVERNVTKLFDFSCVNDIRICEKIKKTPYFYLRFELFSHYHFIKIGELKENERVLELEQTNIIHTKNNDKYVLFTYKNENNVNFYHFMLRLPSPKLFVFHIIDSFSYVLENLLILQKNKICFFSINTQNMAFNKGYKPILRNFSESIQINKLDVSYITDVIKQIEDYTFKPLEVRVLFYLIHNEENTLSYSSIEDICELFVKNNCILSLFSLEYREKYLQTCINVLKKYINNHKNDIISDIMKYADTWDNYSLSILYLFFIGNFNKVFCLKDCFLSKFSVLLNKNTNPDPLKRESLQKTQDAFQELMNHYSDWSFVNDLSLEKYEFFLEKILSE